MASIDFGSVDVLSFDCYGTLIDWETGILGALRKIVSAEMATDEQLLTEYAGHEAAAETGPWKAYREILAASMSAVCGMHGVRPTEQQVADFGASVAHWPAFSDSAGALARLRERFDLAVITNCDDDLFAFSNRKLGEPFRWVVTAQQARSYKPNTRNFELAFERIGRPKESVVHVAQSLYHDHVPARAMGLRTVWVNRRLGRPGAGATPVAEARPDMTFPDMASFASVGLRHNPVREGDQERRRI